jgi:MFS family permease
VKDPAGEALPHRYWRQWWASAVSNLGDGINFAALPLLAYTITDDERLLSLTTLAVILPWLVLALPVGVAVDRFDRRLLMVGANLVRVGLFGVIALAVQVGDLSIWWLLAMLAVVGACEVVFDSSAQAFLPMIVPARLLPRANSYLLAAEVVAGSLVGLSIGAILFAAADGLPFALNAVSFAVAALLIVGIRVAPHRAGGTRNGAAAAGPLTLAALLEGVRWLRADPLLRALAWMLAVSNLSLMLGQGVFVKYAAEELGVSGTGYGVLLAVTAAGAALGGFAGHHVVRTIGLLGAIVVPLSTFAAGQLVFATAPAPVVAGVTGFLMGGAVTVWNVATVSLRQQRIPTERFGRVNSVYRWVGTAASATGALAGGLIAYEADLRTPYVVAGVLTLAGLAAGVGPVVRGLREGDVAGRGQPAERTPAPPSIT